MAWKHTHRAISGITSQFGDVHEDSARVIEELFVEMKAHPVIWGTFLDDITVKDEWGHFREDHPDATTDDADYLLANMYDYADERRIWCGISGS